MNELFERKKILDEMYNITLDQLYIAVMQFGYGFCKKCGELEKRCECEITNSLGE